MFLLHELTSDGAIASSDLTTAKHEQVGLAIYRFKELMQLFGLTLLVLFNLTQQGVNAEVYAFFKGVADLLSAEFCTG